VKGAMVTLEVFLAMEDGKGKVELVAKMSEIKYS
jgi:hypothetical protein